MRNMLAQPWALSLRNVLRHNPIAQMIYQRWMARHPYEERFQHRLLHSVGPSTSVWDVGANVGFYTQQFLDRGARHVTAFEPAPEAVLELRRRFGLASACDGRVTIIPAGLSDTSGLVRFSADGASALNRIVDVGQTGRDDSVNNVKVAVLRADAMLKDYGIAVPNLVKIDVEGFELEVLRGFGELLGSPKLRSVFVEVHFRRLHERGLNTAPTEIVSLLTGHGFQVEWLDLSHACATRDRH
jgi:FkbM family methyltransferase